MKEITTHNTLDARGMACPMPSVKTALKLEEMNVGEVLLVITDDPVSKQDLPVWAKASGNAILDIREEILDGREAVTIYVQKG